PPPRGRLCYSILGGFCKLQEGIDDQGNSLRRRDYPRLSTVHAHARTVRVEADNPLPQRPPRCATLVRPPPPACRADRDSDGLRAVQRPPLFAFSNEIVTSHVVIFSLGVTYPDPLFEGRLPEAFCRRGTGVAPASEGLTQPSSPGRTRAASPATTSRPGP